MIVSMLRLPVRAGCERDVVRFYEEREVFRLAAEVGGFRAGRLLQPAHWRSLVLRHRGAGRRLRRSTWLAAPAREELSAELMPLLKASRTAGSTRS